MESNVAPKYKIDNHYLNISHVSKMFKGMIMLRTKVWNFDGTEKNPSLNVIIGKTDT